MNNGKLEENDVDQLLQAVLDDHLPYKELDESVAEVIRAIELAAISLQTRMQATAEQVKLGMVLPSETVRVLLTDKKGNQLFSQNTVEKLVKAHPRLSCQYTYGKSIYLELPKSIRLFKTVCGKKSTSLETPQLLATKSMLKVFYELESITKERLQLRKDLKQVITKGRTLSALYKDSPSLEKYLRKLGVFSTMTKERAADKLEILSKKGLNKERTIKCK